MEREGVDLAVASEGSFGPDPSVPFIHSGLELVLLVDGKNGYEIRGHHRTPETNAGGKYVASVEEALQYARGLGFPEHGVIVRRTENGQRGIYKNVQTEAALIAVVEDLLAGFFTRRVFLEADLRAHRNPTRLKAIEEATKDMIKNIASRCQQCQTPGFAAVDFERGLKCSSCGAPTDLPLNDIYRCAACGYTEKRIVTKYGEFADPRHCARCNP
jgi:hypothetical protein